MKKILTFVLFILAISGCGLSADGKKINFQEYIETPGTLSCSIYYQNTFDPVSEIYRYRYLCFQPRHTEHLRRDRQQYREYWERPAETGQEHRLAHGRPIQGGRNQR